jgi:hypothetical protein
MILVLKKFNLTVTQLYHAHAIAVMWHTGKEVCYAREIVSQLKLRVALNLNTDNVAPILIQSHRCNLHVQ